MIEARSDATKNNIAQDPGMLGLLGYWNIRSMNRGKLEVVKQEMARVNINILGISELK